MILRGTIYDHTTGAAIPGASVQIFSLSGEYTGIGVAADEQGFFYINTANFSNGYVIRVTAVGYLPAQDELYDDYAFEWSGRVFLDRSPVTLPPVVVTANKPNYWWLALLAIPLLDTKKKPAVGKIETSDVLTAGVALVVLQGMGLLKNLLDSVGLGHNPTTGDQSDPGSPWNPGYWRKVYTPAEQTQIELGFTTKYAGYANDIEGAFTMMSDNYTTVKSVFDKLASKANVSFLAYQFEKLNNASLLSFLSDAGPFPWDGLSAAHLQIIIDYVNHLPAKI